MFDLSQSNYHGNRTFTALNAAEKQVLERIGAAPNVRLACQIRPEGNVCMHPVLPEADPADGFRKTGPQQWNGIGCDFDVCRFTRLYQNVR